MSWKQPSMTVGRPGVLGTLALASLFLAGCSSFTTTGTDRSGTEQLLLTNTWDDVLANVEFGCLPGQKVYLDTSHIQADDKGWVIATLQQRLLGQGVILKDSKKDADLVFVAALSAYGTDEDEFYIGLPRGIEVGSFSVSDSAPSLYQETDQMCVVKLAMYAYEIDTSTLVWQCGPLSHSNSLRDRHIFGISLKRQTTVPDLVVYNPHTVRHRETTVETDRSEKVTTLPQSCWNSHPTNDGESRAVLAADTQEPKS